MNQQWIKCKKCVNLMINGMAKWDLEYYSATKEMHEFLCDTHAHKRIMQLKKDWGITAKLSLIPEPVPMLWR